MLLLYVPFSNIVRQFGIIIYRYISQIKFESIQKRAIRTIFSVMRGMSYIFALSYAELPSLQQRRQTPAKELLAEICKGCLVLFTG